LLLNNNGVTAAILKSTRTHEKDQLLYKNIPIVSLRLIRAPDIPDLRRWLRYGIRRLIQDRVNKTLMLYASDLERHLIRTKEHRRTCWSMVKTRPIKRY